jgi:sugar phosphate isomerase/epimerase
MVMDRRAFLASSTALAAFPASLKAQPAPLGKSGLVLSSRALQWLRSPAELAKACVDIGLDHVDLTVGAAPAHVDAARVRPDLPAFVGGLKQAAITVTTVSTPIVDADTPNAEAILDAAAQAGIGYYLWGGLAYNPAAPYGPQLDTLKPRIQKLAALNQKYKIKGLYQPRAGAANVGAAFLDILDLLKPFDPRFVGVQYDTAALLQPVREVFVAHMRLGGAHIGGIAVNDAAVDLDLPEYDQGFYTGTGPIAPTNAGDNTGTDKGDMLAIGGGGRTLPYRYHPKRVGTGMIDLTLIGRTLKEVGFNGPAEIDIDWPLGGVETGAATISLPRETVLGLIKRERLAIEAGLFAGGWSIDIARPAYLVSRYPRPGMGPDASVFDPEPPSARPAPAATPAAPAGRGLGF